MKFKDQFRSTLIQHGYRQSIDLFMTQLDKDAEFEGVCHDMLSTALSSWPYEDYDSDYSSNDPHIANSTSLQTVEGKPYDFDSIAAYYLYCRWIRRKCTSPELRNEITKLIDHLREPIDNETWRYVMHIAFVHTMLKTDMSAFDQF